MNKGFRYAGTCEKERDEYLEKAAKWFESMYLGVEIENNINLKEILSEYEKSELREYVFSIMYPVIEKVGLKVSGQYDIKEPYGVVDNIAMAVLKDFHKYNNERYMDGNYKYPFYVFVMARSRGAIRDEHMMELSLSRRTYDKLRKIERARRYASKKYDMDEYEVNSKTISVWYKALFGEEIVCQEVDQILNFVFPKKDIELIQGDLPKEDDEIEKLIVEDMEVRDVLHKAYAQMRPVEQFIILQQFGFCSDRYKDLSVRQLCCDSDFVRLASMDKVAMLNVEYGTIEVSRPRINGFETRGHKLISPATFYVKEKYINNCRKKCRDIIAAEFKEANIDCDRCLSNVTKVSLELWERLKSDFQIR